MTQTESHDKAPLQPEPGLSVSERAAPPAEPEVSACWSGIGIQGNRTCPELQAFTHCRNCPVYSAAGVRLLDRPLPPGYRDEWTERLGQAKERAPQRTDSVVVFRLQSEWLAFPARNLQEITEPRRIHSLPHRSQGIVLGLASVGGELLVCVSLGHLFGLENLPTLAALRASHRRLLVVNWEGSRLAFPADEIPCTHRLDIGQLKAPPATVAKSSFPFARGVFYWRGHAVGFLNPESLLPALDRSLT